MIWNVVWVLFNFCRGKSLFLEFVKVFLCLNVFFWLLFVSDIDVLVDVCWVFLYLLDGFNDKI